MYITISTSLLFFFQITLQDEELKNKVRVILLNISRQQFPKNKSPINNVFISQEKGKHNCYNIDFMAVHSENPFMHNIIIYFTKLN